jgi:hypothetical protein
MPGAPWGIDAKTREFNIWSGWAVAPHPPDAKHSWSLLQRHIIEVIADGDKRVAAYITDWAALCVQRPAELPDVALVLIGGEGAGKGTLVMALAKPFGRHFLHLATPGQLTSRYNDEQKDKLLVFADESFYAGDRAAANAWLCESARGRFAAVRRSLSYYIERNESLSHRRRDCFHHSRSPLAVDEAGAVIPSPW